MSFLLEGLGSLQGQHDAPSSVSLMVMEGCSPEVPVCLEHEDFIYILFLFKQVYMTLLLERPTLLLNHFFIKYKVT